MPAIPPSVGGRVSIVRAPRPDSAYTTIRNEVLRDKRLSFRALGVLVEILSRPDNWRTDSVALARGRKEGRDSVRSALREMETHGYLVRRRVQGERGRWRTESTVYDEPQESVSAGATEDGSPVVGGPVVGQPDSGEPAVGGSGPIRTTETDYLEEELKKNDQVPLSPPRVRARAVAEFSVAAKVSEHTDVRDDEREAFVQFLNSKCNGHNRRPYFAPWHDEDWQVNLNQWREEEAPLLNLGQPRAEAREIPHCGDCDPIGRWTEATPGRWARCHRCNPAHPDVAARLGLAP